MENRDHSRQVRTASTINIILGIWLIISPWVYGFATAAAAGAAWSSVIVGAAVVALSIWSGSATVTEHRRPTLT